ncbi:hypothetical protein OHZ10_29215 [Burkholderia arboris]|uniref:Uncharacterized protein n=1 Tax=Burkholderia arboris TaxID=488730 RepID=A0ABZ3DPG1_9BURK
MGIRTLMASGLSFAHLSPKGKRASAAEDDREDDERDDERAEGDEPEDRDRDDGDSRGSKGKKGKRAEDDRKDDERDDENAEDDELEEDDSGKGKKGKRAADDEDDERAEDDDDEEEMRGKSAVARARRRERARCAAIMSSKSAGRNIELAANLAFNTSMTRQEALAILRASPAADSSGHSARSAARTSRNPQLGAGGEVHRNPQRESASGWERAFSKVTGKRA